MMDVLIRGEANFAGIAMTVVIGKGFSHLCKKIVSG
jgi:hypothetical protein